MGSGSNEQSLMLFSLFGTVFVDPDEFASLLDGKLPRIRAYTLDLASMARTRPMDSPTALIPVFTESWIEAGRIVQWSPRPEINRESIIKVLYMGLQHVAKKWTQPIPEWKAARNQFVMLFGERVQV